MAETFADILGGEKAEEVSAALLALWHRAPTLPDVVTASPAPFRQHCYLSQKLTVEIWGDEG